MSATPTNATIPSEKNTRHQHGNRTQSSWSALPPAWRVRLAGYDIKSPAHWRRLTPAQRGRLFGVTREMVKQIDKLTRGAP